MAAVLSYEGAHSEVEGAAADDAQPSPPLALIANVPQDSSGARCNGGPTPRYLE